jgi:hypothetical protein
MITADPSRDAQHAHWGISKSPGAREKHAEARKLLADGLTRARRNEQRALRLPQQLGRCQEWLKLSRERGDETAAGDGMAGNNVSPSSASDRSGRITHLHCWMLQRGEARCRGFGASRPRTHGFSVPLRHRHGRAKHDPVAIRDTA